MNFSTMLLTLLLSLPVFAQHTGSSLTNAKIAEIASHRVGRLVDTGKVSRTFLDGFKSLSVTKAGALRKVVIKQRNNSQSLTMKFDAHGNMQQSEVSISLLSRPVINTSFGPLDNVETSLHFLTEATNTTFDIQPFNKNLKRLSLSGNTVIVESSATSKKLEITLSPMGKIVNYVLK